MPGKKLMLAAVLAACIGGQAQAKCASDRETIAFNTRALQSELMVAALSCGQQQDYNAFVTRFQPYLSHYGKTIRAYFDRSYGEEAGSELNRFITGLANTASVNSMNSTSEAFCNRMAEIFHQLRAVEPMEIASVADHPYYARAHGIQGCSGKYRSAAR